MSVQQLSPERGAAALPAPTPSAALPALVVREATLYDTGGAGVDAHIREIGNVIHDPADAQRPYRLYYTAFQGSYSGDTVVGNTYIFALTSRDGRTWARHGAGSIIPGRSLEDPYVVRYPDGEYVLLAEDKGVAPFRNIRRYTSRDGLTWADQGVCFDTLPGSPWEGQDVSSPALLIEGDELVMLYEGRSVGQNGAMGVAVSLDRGATWTRRNGPGGAPVAAGANLPAATVLPWSNQVVPDDLIRVDGLYYAWVHAIDTRVGAGEWRAALLVSADLLTWRDALGGQGVGMVSNAPPAETLMWFGAGTVVYASGDGSHPMGGSRLELARVVQTPRLQGEALTSLSGTSSADDFERSDGPLGAGWTTITGAPSIAGGRVTGADSKVVRAGVSATAGRLSLAVAGLEAGLLYRFQDDANRWVSYLALDSHVVTARVVGGVFTSLNRTPVSATANSELVVEWSGSSVRVLFDGAEIYTAADAALGNVGGVGLYVNNQNGVSPGPPPISSWALTPLATTLTTKGAVDRLPPDWSLRLNGAVVAGNFDVPAGGGDLRVLDRNGQVMASAWIMPGAKLRLT